MRRVAGVFVLLLGLTLLSWVGYNLFVEMQPAARGQSPLPALFIGSLMVFVGVMWISGKQAG